MLPLSQVSWGIYWQAGENMKARVDKKIGTVHVNNRRIGGKPGNNRVDRNPLHCKGWFVGRWIELIANSQTSNIRAPLSLLYTGTRLCRAERGDIPFRHYCNAPPTPPARLGRTSGNGIHSCPEGFGLDIHVHPALSRAAIVARCWFYNRAL